LVDDRFEGTAVGVGTGKILGKIHKVDLTIGGYDFPCSITVMDSKEWLGDKNMDCLFGLDMLKQHWCCTDLGRNVLKFGGDKISTINVSQVLQETNTSRCFVC
jgi:DNA damage-inducible protein 1